MIAVVVVNYRRAPDTLECLRALESAGLPCQVVLVDNGAAAGETDPAIASYLEAHAEVVYRPIAENAGFAAACNLAIDWVLEQEGPFEAVALLNNDAVAEAGWLAAMAARLDPAAHVEMIAAKMLCADGSTQVDSLGIALYRSGFAANRKRSDHPLLGPCGGAALYSVRLLREVRDVTGHVFDPDFFCYAEDTDLAIRARLLGFRAGYAEDALVRHHGSLTSGGGDSDFVMYHGLRNSLCVMQRDLPWGFVLRFWPWMLAARFGLLAKYARRRRLGLLWSVYRDYRSRRERNRACRRALEKRGVLQWSRLAPVVSPHLYEPGYVREQLRALVRPGRTDGAGTA